MKKKKIAIIGVGLMGGAFAKSVKEFSTWGYARSDKSYAKLKKLKILDAVSQSLEETVSGADFVALSLPVIAIGQYFKKIAPFLKKDAIVFDMGSSKKFITAKAKKHLPKYVSFVGCHPLAGSEKSGAQFSPDTLYEGATCIITSNRKAKATKTVAALWRKVGCKVVYISAELHDKVLSSVSHMPHLISFALTQFVDKKYAKFAPASLRDLTRISNSPDFVWADIFISNKINLLQGIRSYSKVLKKFETALRKGDKDCLIKLIKEANTKQKLFLQG
ncbi:MAG: prephenate dehydrogenase [Candidatus Omnitrophica bacterium]|nr:prephenate dehydrogenase [Candidatus Omnitrophota bacterium]